MVAAADVPIRRAAHQILLSRALRVNGLRNLLALEHTRRNLDLNDPATTALQGRIIRSKTFLRRFYQEHYELFRCAAARLPPGPTVEIGSGAGFLKEEMVNVTTSDVRAVPGVDLVFTAQDIPFASGSVSAFFLINVLHHLPDASRFLAEVTRCLLPGGRLIMVEPANTAWGRFVYRSFHHEPFEPAARDWTLPPGGPMSIANGALPWIIFCRDRARFDAQFPSLRVEQIRYGYPVRYLLSGGVSMKQLAPGWSYPLVKAVEAVLAPLNPWLGMFMRIEIRRQ
jgi:Methyltransferase domain